MLPGLSPSFIAGLNVAYLGSAISDSDGSSYNFGDFSAPQAGLLVVLAGGNRISSDRTFTGITIGGSAATLYAHTTSAKTMPVGIGAREVSAGAVNVSAAFSGTCDIGACSVYLLSGYRSVTPVDAQVSNPANVTSTGLTMAYDDGAVGLYFLAKNASNSPVTWSEAVKAATDQYASSSNTMATSTALKLSNDPADAETASWTTSSDRIGFVGGVWR